MTKQRTYAAIDLKSFYASVECVEHGLDPLTTHLVVADASRTEKTICLAVSPSLKSYGISGRARLFEVIQKVKEINAQRKKRAPGGQLIGKTHDDLKLKSNPSLALSFYAAKPRMAHYITYSTKIYDIYLKYIAPEDIHVYSIDEVFIDLTNYLSTYQKKPRELVKEILLDILQTTGITATAGIGTNLYLCKVAMDIVAKHVAPDQDGVRIAQLDEITYRQMLWNHRPITDFWRVGKGYAKKLEKEKIYTMGDIARCSLGSPKEYYNETLLFQLFGVNAELLIDHAWGIEPCTISDIKAYKPEAKSLGSGQVLHEPYPANKAKLIIKEMVDLLSLDLVEKNLVTDHLVLTIGYDITNIADNIYHGPTKEDSYGRTIPKHAQGTRRLKKPTSSSQLLIQEMSQLFDNIINPSLLIRRINISFCHLVSQDSIKDKEYHEQLDLFSYHQSSDNKQKEKLEKEQKLQKSIIEIKKKYGKNSVLKGMNFEEGATTKERNQQIGGHKA